jgi:8-oxo-dGTP diphosphatase
MAVRARLGGQARQRLNTMTAPIDVAVGILMRPNGDVLMGQRPEGKPYAGYWEFPGGKVETGESVIDALKREFAEEIGVRVLSAEPWCGVEHVYPHAHVRLHFYISRDWQGEPRGLEGQRLAWQGSFEVTPILPATIPLLQALAERRSAGVNGARQDLDH